MSHEAPKTEREMLELLAAAFTNGEIDAIIEENLGSLWETCELIGFSPETEEGRKIFEELQCVYIFEDVDKGRRPVRLARTVARGQGHDVWLPGCEHTHELCLCDVNAA